MRYATSAAGWVQLRFCMLLALPMSSLTILWSFFFIIVVVLKFWNYIISFIFTYSFLFLHKSIIYFDIILGSPTCCLYFCCLCRKGFVTILTLTSGVNAVLIGCEQNDCVRPTCFVNRIAVAMARCLGDNSLMLWRLPVSDQCLIAVFVGHLGRVAWMLS